MWEGQLARCERGKETPLFLRPPASFPHSNHHHHHDDTGMSSSTSTVTPTVSLPLSALKAEFKALRTTLAAFINVLKGITVPPACAQAKTPQEAALALSPLLVQTCAPFLDVGLNPAVVVPAPASVADTDLNVSTSGSYLEAMSPPELLATLLDRIWCPLLTRVLFLAHSLTPPQGHAPQAPGHRSGGPPPAGMFSMLDFNFLRTALEVLVLWGVYPCFDEGVGQPLERRPESKAVVLPRAILAWGLAATAVGEAAGEPAGRVQEVGVR